jgi:hypothetical protein
LYPQGFLAASPPSHHIVAAAQQVGRNCFRLIF